ncbi:MAG TPA: imidazole glycerol phosphate synthase subunit HisH [Gemmatimonadaceae bacterium]|nr:imidazole glycerol phosphate synthase subunit HisH [Gemmatimonadaceae bacterium]
MITIVDYGMGNLGSIANMVKKAGSACEIVSTGEALMRAQKIILPGVGSFDAAMKQIDQRGLRQALDEKALVEKVPFLGICLGMQLLTEGSDEGVLPGLGWIRGKTTAFKGRVGAALKVPHMGWNTVSWCRDAPLLAGFKSADEPRFYFVHSYFVECEVPTESMLRATYGLEFDAGLWRENIFGVQFHPEKSHRFGLKLFQNFAALQSFVSPAA